MAFPRRRAENRRQSREDGGPSMREPGHREPGFRSRMSAHETHGSPASRGARKGTGDEPGAGELHTPGEGPGPAARRYAGMPAEAYPSRKTPSGSAPGGMSVYKEGNPPPRGYRG